MLTSVINTQCRRCKFHVMQMRACTRYPLVALKVVHGVGNNHLYYSLEVTKNANMMNYLLKIKLSLRVS
jgi:hypothetical protein